MGWWIGMLAGVILCCNLCPGGGPPVKHVVLFRYKADTSPEQVKAIADAFIALRAKVPGIIGFELGVDSSPEGLSQGFGNVFILTFRDAAARDAYLPHQAHKEFGKLLGPYLDKPLVVDFETPAPATAVEHPEGLLLKKGDRVVMTGDSITQAGGYVRMVKAVVERTYADLGVQFFNAGISGNKVTDLLARAEQDIVAKQPTVITIAIGINDVWHGFDQDHPQGDGPNRVALPQYIETYEKLIALFKEKTRARIFLLTPTVIGEDTERLGIKNAVLLPYGDAVRRLAVENGLGLIELNDAFLFACHAFGMVTGEAKDSGRLTGDGVHMFAPGDFMMAAKILQAWGVPTAKILSIAKQDAAP
jgi:lysophospholipase L1-like esterase